MVIETAELERIKSEVGKTVYKSRTVSMSGISFIYYKMDDQGKVDTSQRLYEEHLPKKYWTRKDIKDIKDCQRVNHQFGPMLNKMFAGAIAIRAEQKLKEQKEERRN